MNFKIIACAFVTGLSALFFSAYSTEKMENLPLYSVPITNYSLVEINQRSLDFQNLLKNASKLNLNEFNVIIGNLDEAIRRRLFHAMLFEFQGPSSWENYLVAPGVKMGRINNNYNWFLPSQNPHYYNEDFGGFCCASETYQYSDYNTPYIDLIAPIYWEDKFSQIKDVITEKQLIGFYGKMYACFNGIPKLHPSRIDVFVAALGQYIKRFPKAV